MRALNSRLVLLDLHSSWNSANQIPISAFAYFHTSLAAVSSSFHQTCRAHKRITSPIRSSASIRKPGDRFSTISNGIPSNSSQLVSLSTSTSRSEAASELELFLELVPLRMRSGLLQHQEIGNLIEVVLDLGRKPLARFPSGDWMISEQPVKLEDLQHAISKVGDFSDDNRSGIDRSLHRISAIRNRKMQIIGLTCRVGRALSGSAEMIRDLIEDGRSLLVIGPPGVGKTTLIREIARMLADEHMKRVVIVDTSNEIGGDGDVPHSGIGRARRMQVPNVNMQHNVMIEAVENHMPETIIIDEIGTELEALAASTIAQRGVQLVGTAHGMTIDNIVKNPSLQILVGGIESVTLGDEEARKRKVQKTILERKGPPTFTCAIEMASKTECRVHHRLDATVDAILAGKSPLFEVRHMDSKSMDSMISTVTLDKHHLRESEITIEDSNPPRRTIEDSNPEIQPTQDSPEYPPRCTKNLNISRSISKRSPLCVYTYKILEADLLQVAKVMGLEDVIDVSDDIGTADAILASSSELKQNPWIRGVAKFHQLPVFVIKSNTMAQMVKAVRMILGMESFGSTLNRPLKHSSIDIEIEDDAPKRKPSLEEIDALEEVRLAIEYIVIPGGEPVELLPRRSEIIARQLELVESYQLSAEKSGTEMNPRLQILPLRLNNKKSAVKYSGSSSSRRQRKDTLGYDSLSGGGQGTSVARLPILPE
ncbi:AAA+ ATPase domain [Macleaya cordata]|uniref:AAA+ ATPase domain n=1 Tax=Macleaya cordata TaxID=56857 RepID=A0A200R5I7_MACCD|nr:AAA+ ATPase domain [Macleaya cordata]